MEPATDSLLAFLAANKDWSFWIALAFAAFENTAIVSFFMPSTAILAGVGALVATGALDFSPIFLGAAIGAVIGSTFSWWLGARFGDRILGLWPLRNHPELVERTRRMFEKYGPMAVIIGHFVGPLRPFAFLMCGISAMPFWYFQLFNIPGSIGWAYLIPKAGEMGGALIGQVWTMFTGG